MKILALGATGAIGDSLAHLLARSGHKVSVTSRSAHSPKTGIRYIVGNAREEKFLNEVLSQHWDAIIDFMVYNSSEFSKRVDHFLQVTNQYVLLSTARVFAASEAPLQEDSPRLLDVCDDASYLATDEYALTKARQEDTLRNSGKANWTIVRPYISFGPARLQLGPLEKEDWLYRAMQGRSIVFCDALMTRDTTLTDSADVAAMMAALIGRQQALGEDFNLTHETSMPWSTVLATYQSVLKRCRGHEAPVLLQDVEAFCKATNPAQVRYDRLYHRRFNTEKIAAFFDTSQMSKPLEALDRHVETALSGSFTFGPINWRSEALRDRAAGEHVRLAQMSDMKSVLRYAKHRYLPVETIKRVIRR
jgi:nucleoside-diphosphate-sugar epimerase